MQTIVTPKLETSREKQPRTQMTTNLNFSYQKCGAGRKAGTITYRTVGGTRSQLQGSAEYVT